MSCGKHSSITGEGNETACGQSRTRWLAVPSEYLRLAFNVDGHSPCAQSQRKEQSWVSRVGVPERSTILHDPLRLYFNILAFKLAAVLLLTGIGLATSTYVKKGNGKFCEFGTFQL